MKKIFNILTVLIILYSCSSAYISKSIPASEVNQIASFESISVIDVILKGNQFTTSDSLSRISTKKLDSIINISPYVKVQTKINIDDPDLKFRFQSDVINTLNNIVNTKSVKNIKTTPLMDSLVKSQNQRFGLCLVNVGFDRTKVNYQNQYLKSLGINLLTLGYIIMVPNKSNTHLSAMIFDSKTSSVVFFNYLPDYENSPTDGKNLTETYKKLFYYYFKDNRPKKIY